MLTFLKHSLKAGCGLAAIGTALLFSVHREWLQLDIFSRLTPEQTYDAFIYSLVITFSAFLILLFVHAASKGSSGSVVTASDDSIAIGSSGKNSTIKINKK